MMTKSDKKHLLKVRKLVDKEKKRLRLNEPKFSVHCDVKTKRMKLVYSVYEDRGINVNNERKIRRKQKDLYLRNISLYDEDALLLNLPKYVDEMMNNINITISRIGNDKDSMKYWYRVYTDNPVRRGNIRVSDSTIQGDKQVLRVLMGYIDETDKSMNNVWNWVKNGKDFLLSYFKYRQTENKDGKLWSNSSVATSYRRIRAFFNWISNNMDGFPSHIINNLPIAKVKIDTSTFTPTEIEKVKKFIKEYEDHPKWDWFIPILMTMLETGCRVSEVANMKINDIEPVERRWTIIGKGDKKRYSYFRTDTLWEYIAKNIYDENGRLRTDKEYVFHLCFMCGQDYGDGKGMYQKEWLDKPFGRSGINHKFKKMVRLLKLNDKLSPHSCRRFFITEMLKKSSGNIPLVAQLVGHNTWDVVRIYAKDVVGEDEVVNVGLF